MKRARCRVQVSGLKKGGAWHVLSLSLNKDPDEVAGLLTALFAPDCVRSSRGRRRDDDRLPPLK